MLALIDYGAGNLFSVQNALDYLGAAWTVTSDTNVLDKADGLILPGVGAFPHAMEQLNRCGLADYLREKGGEKPLLGICLGMQLLFTKGYEFQPTDGLGLIAGEVRLLDAGGQKIPHMGWNDLTVLHPCAMTDHVQKGDYVYFVHSYAADTAEENISCYSTYGQRIPALVRRGNVFGAQFHPEKSGGVGLAMLNAFWKLSEGIQ